MLTLASVMLACGGEDGSGGHVGGAAGSGSASTAPGTEAGSGAVASPVPSPSGGGPSGSNGATTSAAAGGLGSIEGSGSAAGSGGGALPPIGGSSGMSAARGGAPSGGLGPGGGWPGGAESGGTAGQGTSVVPGGGASAGSTAGGEHAGAGGMAVGGSSTDAAAAGGAGLEGGTSGTPADGGASSGGEEPGGSAAGAGAGGDDGMAGDGTSGPNLVPVSEGRIAESGLTVISYGGFLNGESFQQEGIVTHEGYQYTAFWNANRNVVLARRRLSGVGSSAGEWEKFDFTDYRLSADDAHNTISLGVCAGDGTLHLAFDHHGNDLHYRRSVPGLLTDPVTVSWSAGSFSEVRSTLEGTTPVTLVTYPRFVPEPDGDHLLLSARIGESGSGDEVLWEYDSGTQEWTLIGEYIEGTDQSINAYLHGLAYTRGGTRLHAAWCWRDTPDATTNHDLLYATSDDHGRTWNNDAGAVSATSGQVFLTRDTSGISVWPIGQNRGLINQEHLAVDDTGRVHVLLSHLPDAQPDNSDFVAARTRSEFFDYVRETDGTWARHPLGLTVIENFRGKLAISSTRNVYAILPDLRIAAASPLDGFASWTVLLDDPGRFFSDPLIDTTRLQTSNELTIYYPERGSEDIWGLDFLLQ